MRQKKFVKEKKRHYITFVSSPILKLLQQKVFIKEKKKKILKTIYLMKIELLKS